MKPPVEKYLVRYLVDK